MTEPTKKSSSLLTAFRQKLVDKLTAVPSVAEDGSNAAEVKRQRLSILEDFKEKAGSTYKIFSQLGVDLKAAREFSKRNPHKVADLLVSTESWPFEDLSELDAHFGALPAGYCYRYLAPWSHVVPKSVANNANNVIRIPSPLSLVLDRDFQLSGDEIPDRSLGDWLGGQSAELNRIWTLRMLLLLRMVGESEVPSIVPDGAPGAAGPADEINVFTDRNIPELIDDFVAFSLLQYESEEDENEAEAFGRVCDKKAVFNTLAKYGSDAIAALVPLLQHPDVAVRVSASTYLLSSAPNSAWPVLTDAVRMSPEKWKKKRAVSARRHAVLAMWMHEDGKL